VSDSLAARGRQLRDLGLTSLRAFRVLKREFPNAEWDSLWHAAGETPTGITPLWAEHGSSPAEARYRNDPRKDEVL
jgi:hypothetical protein